MKYSLLFYYFSFLFLMLSVQQTYSQKSLIETTGDVFLVTIPTVTFGTTLILGDKKGATQFIKSFVLNQVITLSLKVGINKPRPKNNGDFGFPSGHTSTAFQGASFIHRRYGFKYSIPAYLAAGFTAFSRIDADKHDGYDVLAGTIIGIGSTYIFTTPYQKEHLELSYSNDRGNRLIGFKFKF
ncbi:phosphatase PAP2 family protein [Aquimarina agarilytica]|uniref:phosphatase PAP2 family protein n=1 Tax=Aquimarina agarilytica TaxID=1087449 RepID=UPI0002F0AFDE|nr:phosphatase PAP2 family protein [Aquimarina agarilytica]